MSTLMRFLLIGWVLIFGAAACSPRRERKQVSVGDEAPEILSSPESDGASSEDQAPPENLSESQGSRNYDDLEIVTLLP